LPFISVGEEVLLYVYRRGGSVICIEERRFCWIYRGGEVILYVYRRGGSLACIE